MPTDRACNQCIAKSMNGGRCRRTTCIVGPWCWQHLELTQGLKVGPSTIPGAGKGLFAVKKFKAHDIITEYTGKRITAAKALKSKSQYIIDTYNQNQKVNARKTNSTPGRYANDVRGTRKRPNAQLVAEPNEWPAIQAVRAIQPGTEILVKYGDYYWGK